MRPEAETRFLTPAAHARKYARWPELAAAGLTLALVAWLFLRQLGAQPLQLWDESRLALNALNIGQRHDWLVMYYGRFPDSLNTKPPVMPILQALSFAAFGFSTWALRLPAAVAGMLTAAGLLLFAWQVLRQPWAGIIAALALATMPGFNGYHVARTGEYDALLALFTVGYALSAYAYLRQPRRRWLALFGGALAGALLVKCAAALLPLPALLFYAGRYAPAALRERRVWLTGALAFAPLLLFYGLRELAYPGYLHFTWDNDWGGRVARPLTGATAWWYYLPALAQGLSGWGGALLLGGGLLFWSGLKVPAVARFALWQAAGLVLVASAAQTRLPWYIAHAYPLLALAIGSAAVRLASRPPRRGPRAALLLTLLSLSGLAAGFDTLGRHRAAAAAPLAAFEQYGPALARLDRLPLPSPQVLVLYENYNPLLDFYRLTAPAPRRLVLDFQRLPRQQPEVGIAELLPAQQVLGCLPRVRRLVEQRFATTPLATLDSCWCLRLDRRR
ncbi:ArnT family glycosyltransferase [uncultured Hymenobacter sp.]|uniref:ArnT family glycosyltransferase n=1 Tax=uncultured Hymenobacter sp. TaxID=170016 RepID=UPI0035C9E254